MSPGRLDDQRILTKLNELNAKVLADPANKLKVIREFLEQQPPDDVAVLNAALVVRSIVQANPDQDREVNKTTHLRAAMPLLILSIVLQFTVGLGCIAAGFYAFHLHSENRTEFSFIGVHLSTQSSGVAALVVGAAFLFYAIRFITKKAL